MVSKAQSVIPQPPPVPVAPPPPPPIHLETIFEESGSGNSLSNIDIHYQFNHHQNSSTYKNKNQTVHGLISARSIPSVHEHRRTQSNDNQRKLPIEVRFRDGTKRFIHPALTINTNNRRKSLHSSHQDSSLSKTQQILINTTEIQKKHSLQKPSVLLTIITADELSQAGITPTSTSSSDQSDALALVKTHSNSSLDTIQTVKDISLRDIDEG